MNDYISREAVIKKAMRYEVGGYRTAPIVLLKDVIDLPAADVKPVVRGKWLDMESDHSFQKCSECGELSCCRSNFCPDCGADMREGNNETD